MVCRVNTITHAESLYKILKYWFAKERKVFKLQKGLVSSFSYLEQKKMDLKIRAVRGTLITKLQTLFCYHNDEFMIKSDGLGKWLGQYSFEDDLSCVELYTVDYIRPKCNNCPVSKNMTCIIIINSDITV